MHSRMLHGGLVTACIRLTSAMASARQLSCSLASLIAGLMLPAHVQQRLLALSAILTADAERLSGLSRRLSYRLKAAQSEQRKAMKALLFG